jgi:hypothetical protein
MKKLQQFLMPIFLSAIFVSLDACKSSDVPAAPIDPKDAKALSKVLIFSNDTKATSGNLPVAATAPKTQVTNAPSLSVSTGGGTVYIPVAYTGSTPVAFAYIQVQGADTYFVIPIAGAGSSGQFAIPITLPATLQGQFVLLMQLVSARGAVVLTQTVNIPVKTTIPLACGDGYVDGNAGITLTDHALNGKAGKVTIDYETYEKPDRIDVFLDGKWVAGTGTAIAPPPPLSTCANPGAGFVGKNGTFSIPVSTSNKIIQVYVSGCTGSTTGWDYDLNCPN